MTNFKIGDRVEFLEHYSKNAYKGDRGTVTGIREGIDGSWAVANGEHQLIDIQMDNGRDAACFPHRLKLANEVVTPAVDVLSEVLRVSNASGHRRPLTPVMLQLQEELGELSTEVAIATGTKRRAPSEDGVAGEAVDVAIVALDIAMLETGGDIEAIKAIFARKLAKWESYL